MTTTLASRLSEWIVGTRVEDVPPTVLNKAKLHILDTLGVTLAGAADKAGQTAIRYVDAFGGKQDCSVIGASLKTNAPLAALANGCLGHAVDFDDNSYSYIGHVSVSVLPAALAMGELLNVDGLHVMGAFIIGTEVACKVGALVTPKLYEDGWHTTSVIGIFGAAAAAGKLLDLTPDQMRHALAIAVSESSGLKGNFGTMTKPFQVGRSAEKGVMAALLAKDGLTGAPDIFEKKYGFFDTFKASAEWEGLGGKMGAPFDIDRPGFYIKEFPSCSSTHPALNALINLIQKYRVDTERIAAVECIVTPLVETSLSYHRPKDALQARFSMEFCLAVALANQGKVGIADFSDGRSQDDRIKGLMDKIVMRISSGSGAGKFAPADGPERAVIAVLLKDGRRYCEERAYADWRPDQMPSWEQLAQKYRGCALAVLPKDNIERSLDRLACLEQVSSIRNVLRCLTGTQTVIPE